MKTMSEKIAIVLIITLLFLHLLPAQVIAAKIYGVAYSWDTLEPLNNVIVVLKKDGEVLQQIVSKNGSYSFEVSPGRYEIVAEQRDEGLIAAENVTVSNTSSCRFDLILFPNLSNLSIEMPEFPEKALNESIYTPQETGYYPYAVILISLAILVSAYILKRRENRRDAEVDISDIPDDLREVVEILKKEGGRITQKELRKRVGCSEAKMSLMIADLERRGVVEKIKKGRGNIIFLKDEFLK